VNGAALQPARAGGGSRAHAPNPADVLERCRALVTPALRASLRRLQPRVELMASFSLGWCAEDGAPMQGSAGKGVRPALALLSAQAAGAPPEAATAAAVAVELVHVFSLVHDDIMDGDERRRHRPTLWRAFGTGAAVLAGDAMLALAVEIVGERAAAAGADSARILSTTLVDLVNGQAEDISFETRPWTGPDAVTAEEYTGMARRKTGSLLGCAAALGAQAAGAHPGAVDAMADAGRDLGLAFQAVDDLLGIWGDPAVTGKPVFSDLRRRKKTLPVLFALSGPRAHPARTAELVRLLKPGGPGRAHESDLHRAAALISSADGDRLTAAQARLHTERACEAIRAQSLDRVAAAEMISLAEFLLARAY
jgi:geranylgeranyl diphosphate synthase, type I